MSKLGIASRGLTTVKMRELKNSLVPSSMRQERLASLGTSIDFMSITSTKKDPNGMKYAAR